MIDTAPKNDQERHLDCRAMAWFTKANGFDVTEASQWLIHQLYQDVKWEVEHRETPAEIFPAAPRIMQHIADQTLWRRIFRNEEPGWYELLLRKYAVAFFLFRAVVHTDDPEAKRILFDAGGLTLDDIVDLEEKRAD
jgi:hypothetical protein